MFTTDPRAALLHPVEQHGRPATHTVDDPIERSEEALNKIVPPESNKPYDIRRIIELVVDDGYFFEIQEHYARNIVIGFARLNGQPIGVVANQPAYLAGVLDIDASVKGARFVRFCDCFNVPIITFEDVPGFLPGVNQEYNGIIRHGAKLLYAYAKPPCPRSPSSRARPTGAYCVMGSKHVRTDVNFAYPTAEIAVMGAEGAVGILYRREIESAADKDAARREKIEEYQDKFARRMSPPSAASLTR